MNATFILGSLFGFGWGVALTLAVISWLDEKDRKRATKET